MMHDYLPFLFTGWAIGFWIIWLVIFILYLITLMNVFNAVSPANRKLEPGLVFLLLVPLFNLIWNFIVIGKLRDSLQAEYAARDLQGDGFGYGIGLAMSILFVCGIIPLINLLVGIPALICWIIFWVKMAGYRKTLAAAAA
ncbi:MAG TPA: hypothetical protein VFK12_05250 [Gammaproteobacteria bacterium]|jgi:hypothetical protein|nr:hypothetical protein [Gammaproteobacteria bacterium]